MTDEWLNTDEAAKRLGITTRTLYRFMDQGRLPSYRFGRVFRLKVSDVLAFIEDCRVEPGSLSHLYPDTGSAEEGESDEGETTDGETTDAAAQDGDADGSDASSDGDDSEAGSESVIDVAADSVRAATGAASDAGDPATDDA